MIYCNCSSLFLTLILLDIIYNPHSVYFYDEYLLLYPMCFALMVDMGQLYGIQFIVYMIYGFTMVLMCVIYMLGLY